MSDKNFFEEITPLKPARCGSLRVRRIKAMTFKRIRAGREEPIMEKKKAMHPVFIGAAAVAVSAVSLVTVNAATGGGVVNLLQSFTAAESDMLPPEGGVSLISPAFATSEENTADTENGEDLLNSDLENVYAMADIIGERFQRDDPNSDIEFKGRIQEFKEEFVKSLRSYLDEHPGSDLRVKSTDRDFYAAVAVFDGGEEVIHFQVDKYGYFFSEPYVDMSEHISPSDSGEWGFSISTCNGLPVYSGDSGTVAYYGVDVKGLGRVCIELSNGEYAYYDSLVPFDKIDEYGGVNIKYGSHVGAGQLIGYTYSDGSWGGYFSYKRTKEAPTKAPWTFGDVLGDDGYLSPYLLQSYVDRGYTLPSAYQELLDKYYEYIAENPDKDEGDFQREYYPDDLQMAYNDAAIIAERFSQKYPDTGIDYKAEIIAKIDEIIAGSPFDKTFVRVLDSGDDMFTIAIQSKSDDNENTDDNKPYIYAHFLMKDGVITYDWSSTLKPEREPKIVSSQLIVPNAPEKVIDLNNTGGDYLYNVTTFIPAGYDGSMVVAAEDGMIAYIGYYRVFGNVVYIELGENDYAAYCHLSGFAGDISVGDTIKAGKLLGFAGNTGMTAGTGVGYARLDHVPAAE